MPVLALVGSTIFLWSCDGGATLGTSNLLEVDSGARPGGGFAPAASHPLEPRYVLLVLRLGDDRTGAEVEVLRRLRLHSRGSAPGGSAASARVGARRRLGRRHRRWRGRYEVRSASGSVLSWGRFHLPRRRHALFAGVGGPVEAVDVELRRPVLWLRVDLPPGARSLVLFDSNTGKRLGEVRL